MTDRQRVYYLAQANVTNSSAQGVQSGPRFTIARHGPTTHPIPASVNNLYPTLNPARFPNDSHGGNFPLLTAIVGLPAVKQILPSGVARIKPLVLSKPTLGSSLPSHDGTGASVSRTSDVGIMLEDKANPNLCQAQQPAADISSSGSMVTARPSILRRKVAPSTSTMFPFPQRRPTIPVESLQNQTAPATVVTVANDKLIYCVDGPLSSANISTEKVEEPQLADSDAYFASSERKRPRKQQLGDFSDRTDRPTSDEKRGSANGRVASRAPKASKPVHISSRADGTSSEESEKRTEEKKPTKVEILKAQSPARRRQLHLSVRDTKSTVRQNHFLFPEEAGAKFDPRSITDDEIFQYCPLRDNVQRLNLIQDRIDRYSTNVSEVLGNIAKLKESIFSLPVEKCAALTAEIKEHLEKSHSKAVVACEMLGGALRNTMDNVSILLNDYNLYNKPVEIDDSLGSEDEEEEESGEDDQPGPSCSRR
ncbi:hypothetical protein M514_02842 [Trichuris suis]|uniref:Uncharacterized protein n=1 Tax=Trichuris suis TaxID=68888 RepID=A0A085NEQ6_9BILA|nr:hypothetical protein M513_02842 [Trichuris suis]KFD67952.1 hypothetical protein M514_02842 [Trichuris suis]